MENFHIVLGEDSITNKKISVVIPIIWLFTTIVWTISFCISLNSYEFSNALVVLQGVTVLISLAAAITNFIRYKKAKENDEN